MKKKKLIESFPQKHNQEQFLANLHSLRCVIKVENFRRNFKRTRKHLSKLLKVAENYYHERVHGTAI